MNNDKSTTILPNRPVAPQIFDYILVLDFEATCDNQTKLKPQEIIEFPVLKVDTRTFEVVDQFHQYVQPNVNKQLTPFCTELTGITQNMVDGQPDLTETLKTFDEWIGKSEGLKLENGNKNFIFLTCGDWDLKVMLPSQAGYLKLTYASYLKEWINVKKAFKELTNSFPRGMTEMLSAMNLKLEGRHHSGIDDCKNIARIVKEMASRGHMFKATGQL